MKALVVVLPFDQTWRQRDENVKAKPVQYRTARRQREDAYPLTYNTSSDAELLRINFTPERIIRPNVNHMHVRTIKYSDTSANE